MIAKLPTYFLSLSRFCLGTLMGGDEEKRRGMTDANR